MGIPASRWGLLALLIAGLVPIGSAQFQPTVTVHLANPQGLLPPYGTLNHSLSVDIDCPSDWSVGGFSLLLQSAGKYLPVKVRFSPSSIDLDWDSQACAAGEPKSVPVSLVLESEDVRQAFTRMGFSVQAFLRQGANNRANGGASADVTFDFQPNQFFPELNKTAPGWPTNASGPWLLEAANRVPSISNGDARFWFTVSNHSSNLVPSAAPPATVVRWGQPYDLRLVLEADGPCVPDQEFVSFVVHSDSDERPGQGYERVGQGRFDFVCEPSLPDPAPPSIAPTSAPAPAASPAASSNLTFTGTSTSEGPWTPLAFVAAALIVFVVAARLGRRPH